MNAPTTAGTARSNAVDVLLTGAFLASSWTWVIGMFLPVLLIRDFGVLGFLVFALPNCVGAGAMGWVLRNRTASVRMVNNHAAACRVFSIVTVLFHVFFIAWLASMPGMPARAEVLVVLATATACVIALLPLRAQGTIGLLLTLGVAITIATWVGQSGVGLDELPAPALPTAHVLYLAPVCVLGFLLCPYLDLTFHRAHQHLAGDNGVGAGASARAFGVGFLGLFPIMILFTLAYAGVFLASRTLGLALVAYHIAVQSGFTVGAHVQALASLADSQHASGDSTHDRARSPARVLTAVLIAWLCSVLILSVARDRLALTPPGALPTAPPPGLGAGEFTYRGFMASYGLVFPAYVWLCMTTRMCRTRPLLVFGCAVALAAPFYYLGFMNRETIWLLPGVGIVILARLALR